MRPFRQISIPLFFILAAASCKTKWQGVLASTDKRMIYGNSPNGWKLVQEIKNEFDTYFTLEKNDSDTVKLLKLYVDNKDGNIMDVGYQKQFRCDVSDTCYLKMNGQDTAFFYSTSKGQKKFMVGEYEYRYTHFKMDSSEMEFYIQHEDSLRRVKGNKLPKLKG